MGPTQQRISVLFASNLAMTRELYLKAFNRPCGIRMVASAATGDEIIEALEAKSVDIALRYRERDGHVIARPREFGILYEPCEHPVIRIL